MVKDAPFRKAISRKKVMQIDATLLVLFVDFARYSLLFKVLDGFVHCFGSNCDAENPAKSAIPFLNHNSWHWGRSFRGTRGAKLTSVARAGWNGLDTNILAFVASVNLVKPSVAEWPGESVMGVGQL